MIYHDCKQPVQTDVSRSESNSLVTEHICGEVAGDMVERSWCEEGDVGEQRRNVYPVAGGTVRLLSVLAMQTEADGFSRFPAGRSECCSPMTMAGDLGQHVAMKYEVGVQ